MDIDDGSGDDTQGAQWQVRVFHDRRGRYPAFHKKDRPFLARSFKKLEYLSEVVRFQRIENIPRELVDTIKGAIKELRSFPGSTRPTRFSSWKPSGRRTAALTRK